MPYINFRINARGREEGVRDGASSSGAGGAITEGWPLTAFDRQVSFSQVRKVKVEDSRKGL